LDWNAVTQKRICAIVALTLSCLVSGCRNEDIEFATIGTGSMTGLYYPTGGAIARMINRQVDRYGIKATFEATAGSVYNINAVLAGDLEFGIAQSDRQFQAWRGLAEWSDRGPQTDLRAVFSIHPETITLVASVNSGIRTVADLRGKRVNLGNIGSGHLQNARDVLAAAGLSEDDLTAERVRALEAPGLLQDGRIDAFFYTVGHPNSSIEEATFGQVKVRLVPIDGAVAERLVGRWPYYSESHIPQQYYRRAANGRDVVSVGVKTTVVTSTRVDTDVVYAITREVFENFEEFRQLHPAYSDLTREDMLRGLPAPLHPGARKYYREAGLDRLTPAEPTRPAASSDEDRA
jgi:hypothetical protein